MVEKSKYNDYIKDIKKLMTRYAKLQKQYKGYNLSGSAWMDYASSGERSRMFAAHGDDQRIYEEHNHEIDRKKSEVIDAISRILALLLASGYTKDQIRKSCFSIGKLNIEEYVNTNKPYCLDNSFAYLAKKQAEEKGSSKR